MGDFLMFLVVLGISKGLWSSLRSSPSVGKVASGDWELAVSERDTTVEEKQDCLGDAAPKTMKTSNDTLTAGRQSSSGTMDFVVRIWSNRFKLKLATVIGCLAGPVNDNFAERLRVMHKRETMVSHLIGLASGSSLNEWLAKSLATHNHQNCCAPWTSTWQMGVTSMNLQRRRTRSSSNAS